MDYTSIVGANDDDGSGFWGGLSRGQKTLVVVGATAGLLLICAGVAYAVSHGGGAVVIAGKMLAIGKAAPALAAAV